MLPAKDYTSPLSLGEGSGERANMKQSDLLKNWKKRKTAAPNRITRRPEGTPLRPTAGQRRLFLLQQLHPGNPFYQYAHRYELHGPLDVAKLRASFGWVAERQEVLRHHFSADEQGDITVSTRAVEAFPLEVIDLRTATAAAISKQQDNFTLSPFDLAKDVLFRARLLRLGGDHHRLLISMHHIIGDRGSLLVLEGELFAHYTRLVEGKEDHPAPPTLTFADYAHWEATRPVADSHYDYWREQLSGELPRAELPADRQRPALASHRGQLLEAGLNPDTSAAINALARRQGTTANVVFLAVLNAFLFRYTAQEDILIGAPVSTRDRTETEALVGFLNETVVLRNQVDPEQGLEALVAALRPTVETALSHKDVSFDWLVDQLQPQRSGGANPFFQTMFVYNGQAPERTLPAELEITDHYVDLGTAKFDLTLFATDLGDTFRLGFEYAKDLFDEDTVATMLRHFVVLLEATLAAPTAAIVSRRLLTEEDQNTILKEWNPTLGEALTETLLPDFFARHVAERPDAPAITDGADTLSYRELDERSNMLAYQLGRLGLQTGDAVGLYCGRTVELLVGILGIQRAGGAYVPLDPDYPQERTDYILRDAGAGIIAHTPGLEPPGKDHVFVGIPRAGDPALLPNLPVIRPEQTAYVIHTSGSTGKPKGIPISHANLAHSTAARFRFYPEQMDSFLLLSSFSFDSSVAGIFWSLAAGGKLVLTQKRAEQDPAALARLIAREGVTHTLLLPSLYQLILEFAEAKDLASLRTVMVAGEACPPVLVQRHFGKLPATELVNEYGPTEGTVWSTAHRIQPEDARGSVPIGRPIPGVGHYILDAHLNPVPVGVAGELHLSGPGLSRGYLNRPDLSREQFLESDWGRLYRTGDQVRYRKNGLIDFLGRGDAQIKIRGYRVELSEVARSLDAVDGISSSVIKVLDEGQGKQLAAYYTTASKAVDEHFLRSQLRQTLPDYMVPAIFIFLEEFPRLPNGKVDLRSLPLTSSPGTRVQRPNVAPETETEKTLAAIWSKVLGQESVGRHADFFALGGDSLKSIRVIAAAKEAGLPLAPHQLFNHPTLSELAAAISTQAVTKEDDTSAYETLVLLRKGGSQAPLFCIHSGGGHVFFYRDLAGELDDDRSVYALQPPGLMGEEKVQDSIEAMAADYIRAIRRVQPQGPYHLLGTCFSNAVVVEMAHQLRQAGATVGELFIVDSGTGGFLRPDAELAGKNPLDSLLRLIKGGHWDKLAMRLRNRFILRKRSIEGRFNEQKKNLYGTIGSLNTIYDAYEWKPVAGGVNLLRSSEFASQAGKDHHVRRWTALSELPPAVQVVTGEHQTIFEPPAVKGLAQAIDQCFAPVTI